MMECVEEWVMENKEKIELELEIMGKGYDFFATTAGKLNPVLEAVLIFSKEILSNPESKDVKYLTELFEKVNQKLEAVKNEIDSIYREMEKSSINKKYFEAEARILSQYKIYLEFVNASTKFKESSKRTFIRHFQATKGDLSLLTLYNMVIGDNPSGESVLETVLVTEERSRRAVEEFCAHLKKLFFMGLIAVIGHASLEDQAAGKLLLKEWGEKMEEVERRMKAAVDDCTNNFAAQARTDMENQLQEK
ncbi:protein rapunzel-like [Lepisosteus oculatus]|uniref:protein rapunzel-like n=1 Tax=Lepisosteus oculatus TaxID=7918 RepID=UPI00371848A8